MFGRVIVLKNELKFKEFDIYRGYYCGLCGKLREYGFTYALSLNYDMTFLSILLSSLYETPKCEKTARCICHMCKKHLEITDSLTDYVADMTILLAYYKCLDDFEDDKNAAAKIYSGMIKKRVLKIRALYPQKCSKIKQYLSDLSTAQHSSLEEAANLFGNVLGEIFTPFNDEWHSTLYQMGFYLGKFIYIADAYEDFDSDIKKNKPNPLREMHSLNDFHKECIIILNMMATECALCFEKLPLVENIEILRNIIYSGIWQNIQSNTPSNKD